jgi:hypothetical protein
MPGVFCVKRQETWSRGRDSNPRPALYESAALPLSYPGSAGRCCGRRRGTTGRRYVYSRAGRPRCQERHPLPEAAARLRAPATARGPDTSATPATWPSAVRRPDTRLGGMRRAYLLRAEMMRGVSSWAWLKGSAPSSFLMSASRSRTSSTLMPLLASRPIPGPSTMTAREK